MDNEVLAFKKSKTITHLKQKNKYFRQQAQEGYDPQLIPAKVKIAEMHMGASKVGREALNPGEDVSMCPCCSKYVQKEPLNIRSGYPMYFEFIRFCILLLSVLLVFNGLYGLITNGAFGNACLNQVQLNELSSSEQKDKCFKNWVTVLSLGNKQTEDKLLVAQSFLNVISIFIIMVLFQRFRRDQRKIDIDCDESDLQANDYCALFSNLPSTLTDQNGNLSRFNYADILKQYFTQNLIPERENEIEIVKVGLCFNCDPIISIQQQISKLTFKKQTLMLQKKDNSEISKKIIQVQNKKREMQQEYNSGQNQEFIKKNFTGYAYVIFQKEQDKEEVIKYYQQRSFVERWLLWHTNKQFICDKNEIEIIQAPDPNNINWSYLKFSRIEKNKRRIIFFFLTIICLGTCLSIILGLNYAQDYVTNYDSDDNKGEVSLISIAISICIVIINPLLKYFIILISQKEGHSTTTSLFISIAIRSAFASFLNCSIILVFTQVLIVNSGSVFGKIFGKGGLALNINTVFITQVISANLSKLINPAYIIKYFTRKGFQKYIDKLDVISQQQLNNLFENPEFKIEEEYAYILQIIYSTLFYAPVLPLCLIWGILTLFFKYWVDKYNLIKKSSIKFNPSLNLCLQMTEMLEYCLPLYSLSNMLAFIYITKGEIHSLSIFGFLIGLFHAFLPMQELNQKLFPLRERVPNICTYNEVSDYFGMDYDRENPVIQDIAIQEHISKVKGQISQIKSPKKNFQKNFNNFNNDVIDSEKINQDSPIIQAYPILDNQIDVIGMKDSFLFSGENNNGDRKDTNNNYQPQNTDKRPILEHKLSTFNTKYLADDSPQTFTPIGENITEFQNLTEKNNQSNEAPLNNKLSQQNYLFNGSHIENEDIVKNQYQNDLKNQKDEENSKQQGETNNQQSESSDDDDEQQDDFVNSYKPKMSNSGIHKEQKKKNSVFARNKDQLKSYKPQKTVFRQKDDFDIEAENNDKNRNYISDQQYNL